MCRVPFGLMPVMAATAVRSTARPSHASQLITDDSIHVDPALRTPFWKKVVRQPGDQPFAEALAEAFEARTGRLMQTIVREGLSFGWEAGI